MATAELAVAMPAVIVVLTLCLSAVSLGIDQVRCVDAARAGVRLLARGEQPQVVRSEVARAAPGGAAARFEATGDRVTVAVTGRLPGPLRWLGVRSPPTATATAAREESFGWPP